MNYANYNILLQGASSISWEEALIKTVPEFKYWEYSVGTFLTEILELSEIIYYDNNLEPIHVYGTLIHKSDTNSELDIDAIKLSSHNEYNNLFKEYSVETKLFLSNGLI